MREDRKSAISAGRVIVVVRPFATRQEKGDFEGCDRTYRTVQLVFKMLQHEKIKHETGITDGKHHARR